jgi:hypothetical protein
MKNPSPMTNRLAIAVSILGLVAIIALPALFTTSAEAGGFSCRYTYGFNLQGQYVVTGYDCN